MEPHQKARAQNLLRAAQAKNLDCVLCMLPENIFYFSGFRSTFYTRFTGVLLPVAEPAEPALVAWFIDEPLVNQGLWSPPWCDRKLIWGPGGKYDYPDHLAALKDFLRPGMRLGVDGIQFDFYQQLLELFPGLEVVNLSAEILEIRMIKDAQEIELIQKAFVLAERVMAQVPGWLEHPLTEKDLAAELNYQALKAGAEGIFYPTLVSAGSKMLAFHCPPLDRAFQPHELIRIAFGLAVEGYGSDIVRHFCLGALPEALEPLGEAYFQAMELVGQMARPRIMVADLVAAVSDLYRQHGVYDYWVQNIGHGLALTIHEPPRICAPGQVTLRENMVLAIEPILALAPWGAMAHCDGLLITADGSQWLSGQTEPGRRVVII